MNDLYFNPNEWMASMADPCFEMEYKECKSDEEREAVCMKYALRNILLSIAAPVLFCICYGLYKLILYLV